MNKQWLETLRANLKANSERQDADAERAASFWDKSRDPRLWRKLGDGSYQKRSLKSTD